MPHVLYHSLALSSSDFSRYVKPMAVNSDMSVVTDSGVFAIANLRRRLANTFVPTPWIYWTDLLLSSCVGWGAFVVGATTPFLSFTYIVTMLVAVIALLRATIFIHELSHLKRGTVPGTSGRADLLSAKKSLS